jgi:hypothetical protein
MMFFHNSIISTLFMKAIMNGKQITSFTIIKETLKHYKLSFTITMSIFVVLLAFSKLGAIPGIFSIITLGLIHWGVIGLDIFNPIKETNLSESVSYNQAIKKCPVPIKNVEKSGFFLYDLIFGQKGGNITKQLKKIGKHI